MDKYVASYTFFVIVVTLIVYVLIAAMISYGVESSWYQGLKKSDVEININRYFFIGLYFFTTLLPYLLLWSHPLLLVLLLVGALISLFWVTIFFVGQHIEVSVWLTVVVFLYYFWLFSRIWIISPFAAAFLIPLLVFIIFIFYHVVHLAFINNVML